MKARGGDTGIGFSACRPRGAHGRVQLGRGTLPVGLCLPPWPGSLCHGYPESPAWECSISSNGRLEHWRECYHSGGLSNGHRNLWVSGMKPGPALPGDTRAQRLLLQHPAGMPAFTPERANWMACAPTSQHHHQGWHKTEKRMEKNSLIQ